jgi:hypothetical protein
MMTVVVMTVATMMLVMVTTVMLKTVEDNGRGGDDDTSGEFVLVEEFVGFLAVFIDQPVRRLPLPFFRPCLCVESRRVLCANGPQNNVCNARIEV